MCQGRVKRQQRVPENLLATSCSLTCVEILTYVFLAFSLALPARVDRSLGSASHGPLPSSTWPPHLTVLLMGYYALPRAATPVSLQPKGQLFLLPVPSQMHCLYCRLASLGRGKRWGVVSRQRLYITFMGFIWGDPRKVLEIGRWRGTWVLWTPGDEATRGLGSQEASGCSSSCLRRKGLGITYQAARLSC